MAINVVLGIAQTIDTIGCLEALARRSGCPKDKEQYSMEIGNPPWNYNHDGLVFGTDEEQLDHSFLSSTAITVSLDSHGPEQKRLLVGNLTCSHSHQCMRK